MKRLLLHILAILVPVLCYAGVSVGEWETHFAYIYTDQVVKTPNKIYALAEGKLFSVSRQDYLVEEYSKIDGLSGNNIVQIGYDDKGKSLVLAYNDAYIDIISEDGKIYPVADLAMKNMSVNKSFNQIYFDDKMAYLSTGFGILKLNLTKYEIADTYFIGYEGAREAVYGFTADDTLFYALMDTTIKCAKRSGVNLLDYANWSSTIPLPCPVTKGRNLVYYNDRLVMSAKNGNVYSYNGEFWNVIFNNEKGEDVNLSISDGSLIVCCDSHIMVYDKQWNYKSYFAQEAVEALYDGEAFWVASGNQRLHRIVPDVSDDIYCVWKLISAGIQKLSYQSGRIWVAPGYLWVDRSKTQGVLEYYEDSDWTCIYGSQLNALGFAPDSIFADIVSISVDPKDRDHVFLATAGEGVYEIKNKKCVALYNKESTNGVIIDIRNYGEHYVRTTSLSYDHRGNLFVLMQEVDNPVAYMGSDGVWRTAPGYDAVANRQLMLSLWNSKKQFWIAAPRKTTCLFVKDDGGTINDVSDDKNRFFTQFIDRDGNVLIPQFIYDIKEDRNGSMWIGTDLGPIVFNSVKNVFDADYRVQRIKINRNDESGFADFLLDNTSVTSIAVDGGNRKWLGTSGHGLYLVSADGQKEIYHFTKENSPLSSDNIVSVEVNGKSGEVFIATDDGLYVYREGVTDPESKFDKDKVFAYPNPVRPEYSGLITISGLEENSLVRITDASGNVVFQGESLGGSVIWDGKNRGGQYVTGGVYFVLCSNSDEENNRSIATKILIVR